MGVTFTTEPPPGRKTRLERDLVVVKVGNRRKTAWGQVTGPPGWSRLVTGVRNGTFTRPKGRRELALGNGRGGLVKVPTVSVPCMRRLPPATTGAAGAGHTPTGITGNGGGS